MTGSEKTNDLRKETFKNQLRLLVSRTALELVLVVE